MSARREAETGPQWPPYVAAVGVAASLLFAAPLGEALRLDAPPDGARDRGRAAHILSLAAQETFLDRGVVGTGLSLRRLDGVKRVLLIGAHPDDEDTALLAALARGMGAETAYLSLTRGDGGQNLIGPELGEGLGVVRTGELQSARELDGGRQFFTRAFDFGYSKNAEETFRMWPREELVRDVVWVMRTFRPHVVVSIFSGTPADGHGQHQAAGIVAREAFEAAGDPERFPEQLGLGVDAWAPLKLYRRFRRVSDAPSVEVPTGRWDSLLGRSHFQLAMASRSRHRSQDMGVGQPLGPRSSSLFLDAVAPGVDRERDAELFAGVDTALVPLARSLPAGSRGEVERSLRSYREAIRDAEGTLDAMAPWGSAPHLAAALSDLRGARAAALRAGAASTPATGEEGRAARDPSAELLGVLDRRIGLVERTLVDAAGVVVDVRAADDLVVPGQEVEVQVEVWNGGPWPVERVRPVLDLPVGWEVEAVPASEDVQRSGSFFFRGGGGEPVSGDEAAPVAPGESGIWRYRVRLPVDAELSRLYYLAEERDGALYRWPDDPGVWALPRQPPPMHADVEIVLSAGGALEPPPETSPARAAVRSPAVDDVAITLRREARFVGVDKAAGEFRTPVLVVPGLSVDTEPGVMVVPTGSAEERRVAVTVRAYEPGGASGRLRLDLPAGWRSEPADVDVSVEEGQEASAVFGVVPPADAEAGAYAVRAVVESGGRGSFSESVVLIDYPHIERAALFEPARTRATVVPVRVGEGLRVGYVMGSGDDGPEALRQLGVHVELLGEAALREGDLSHFDALVLGVRAYETRPDLQGANERVLDFARAGGTVLVQYNKYEFPRGDFAPGPVAMARPHDRVTDETSPFRFIHPENPVFTSPNRIGPSDFEGWVTERGLYFLSEWSEPMTPLLELTDPAEEPKRGALVVSPLGEGLWIYTGLSFFRQLPEGVPGAYRLFANLVSLDAEAWRAWESAR